MPLFYGGLLKDLSEDLLKPGGTGRCGQKLSREALTGKGSPTQKGKPTTEFFRLFKVVGGEQNRMPLVIEASNELPKTLAKLDVDPCGGLIQDDDCRTVDERLGHQDAALHAA